MKFTGAHPRSRGENRGEGSDRQSDRGSSPLTRGKPIFGLEEDSGLGLIPAHAGKTHLQQRIPCIGGAHPRSRGENSISYSNSNDGGWLIPAHAGKTTPGRSPSPATKAHPRSRGENCCPSMTRRGSSGSSPLTRGKLQGTLRRGRQGRLIPAHAGKTHHPDRVCNGHRAHPRSRGENITTSLAARGILGSSPLTRGKPPGPHWWSVEERLIPAHAGKTWSPRRCRVPKGAHPRSRGENSVFGDEHADVIGSSPLTRGKPRSRARAACSVGLIPAHAGKTSQP